MKILVTGNLGYVGPLVVERLRRSRPEAALVGHDAGFFAHLLTGPAVLPELALDEQRYGDVRDVRPADLEAVDAVVHLAAISNDPIGNAYEEVTAAINHRASVAIARAAREAGVGSFVFASSCSVYGAADDDLRTEASATDPLTAYARSKVGTEEDLAELAGPGFAVSCLRFATACGMSPRLRLDLVLNDFVASAVATGRIEILSDGTPWRPLIHVRDMARALDWAIDRDSAAVGDHLVVNVGRDDWNVMVRDLAEAVRSELGDVEVTYGPAAGPDPRSYRVSFARYRDLAPDHQPQVDLAAAVRELRDGLVRMGFADRRFRESQLMRLNAIRRLREEGRLDDDLRWATALPLGVGASENSSWGRADT